MQLKADLGNIQGCGYHAYATPRTGLQYIEAVVDHIASKFRTTDSITFCGRGLSCAILNSSVITLLYQKGFIDLRLKTFRKPNDTDHHYEQDVVIHDNVIIVDGLSSTGRTLSEIIKKVRELNLDAKIYVYLAYSHSHTGWSDYIDDNVEYIYTPQ